MITGACLHIVGAAATGAYSYIVGAGRSLELARKSYCVGHWNLLVKPRVYVGRQRRCVGHSTKSRANEPDLSTTILYPGPTRATAAEPLARNSQK